MVLVDEVHGLPSGGELEAVFPNHDLDYLTPDDLDIQQVLTSGVFAEMQTEIFFDVPPGAEMLYGRFTFQGSSTTSCHTFICTARGTST